MALTTPTLSAPGIGSSLDVNGIVTKLMAVEHQPVDALDQREASFQADLSAYGTLKGALSSLQTTVQALNSPQRFLSYTASVADSTQATASIGDSPASGTYSLEVDKLAQAQKLKSAALASSGATLGNGTITIDFGSYASGAFVANADAASMTVTIAPGQDSLAAVRDAINAANGAASATLVNDGTGSRLVLSSQQSGVANAMRISVADGDGNNADAAGLSRLAFDAGGSSQMTQTVAAQDAAAVIDGINITSASNTLTNVIDGVTLNLAKADPANPTTLTVGRNTAGTTSAVQAFVKAWNDVATTIKSLSAYNPDTKQAATLTGDTTLQAVQSRLRGVLNSTVNAGGIGSLADIGLTTQLDGTLALDSTKLSAVLADPTKDVGALFASSTRSSDSLLKVGATSSTVAAGSYPVTITQLAAQGFATGSQAAATTIVAGVNDTLNLSVDGVSTSVTLSPGAYTADALAAEIRSRVNGQPELRNAGASILASQSGGILTLSSARFGTASTLTIDGGNAIAGLFGTATSTTGVDAGGLIGGVVGTGSGQTLSAIGLSFDVLGGATGDRGALTVGRGLAANLDDLLGSMLASDGLLAARTDSFNASIKDIGIRRDALNLRLDDVEKRYRDQFNALDISLANMQSTSNWLTTQLANLPKLTTSNN